jgi:hypothetical protein
VDRAVFHETAARVNKNLRSTFDPGFHTHSE